MRSRKPEGSGLAARAGEPVPASDVGVLSRFDAFFHTGERSSLADITNSGSEQLRLFGVRAGVGGGGSAILGLPDGTQLSVGVGEEVLPGLVLRAVAQDHVTVARGASVSRIDFGEVPVGAASVPPPPATPQVVAPPRPAPAAAEAAVIDPARLMAEAGLRPRMQGLSVNGFTVTARGPSAQLQAAGLRAGDVILSVNGIALEASVWITNPTGREPDYSDPYVFQDPDPVPALKEQMESARLVEAD